MSAGMLQIERVTYLSRNHEGTHEDSFASPPFNGNFEVGSSSLDVYECQQENWRLYTGSIDYF